MKRVALVVMKDDAAAPRGVKRGALVVMKGDHDSVETVFGEYELPYELIKPEDLARGTHKLSPGQILFVNCNNITAPHLSQKLVKKVRKFVEAGGWMVTTDWSIDPFVTEGFPGRVAIVPARQRGDITVSVKSTQGDATLLRGIFRGSQKARWWLESASIMFEVVPGRGVRVLILSDDLHRLYKAPTVACEFWPGKGRVVHVLGHLHQEGGNKHGIIAMHRLLFNLIRERYPDPDSRPEPDRDH